MKLHLNKFIAFTLNLIFISVFLFVAVCKASNDVANKKTISGPSSSFYGSSEDSEEEMVIEAAKKKAKKLGYDVKSYEIHTFFHGHDCTVNFYLPKSDFCKLKIYLRTNNVKVFYVEELKNSKWVGHK